MATSKATIDYILDQLAGVQGARARKMFGEYAVYSNEKVVALVCDDSLFVKKTEAGKNYIENSDIVEYEEGPPYEKAKPWILIAEEGIEDREWLTKLIRITEEHTEAKKKKKV